MKIANDIVIYEVVFKQNLRAFLDISDQLSVTTNNRETYGDLINKMLVTDGSSMEIEVRY